MPVTALASRYRRSMYGSDEDAPEGVLSPYEDDTSPAMDPSYYDNADAMLQTASDPQQSPMPQPRAPSDTVAGASVQLPPLNPNDPNKKDYSYSGLRKLTSMPAPGSANGSNGSSNGAASATLAPAIAPATPGPPPDTTPTQAPGANPAVGQAPSASSLAPRPLPDDITAAQKRLTAAQTAVQGGNQLHSNWAQRLALAALAMTRLAPVANQIVHPKWTEERANQQRELGAAQQQLTSATTLEQAQTLDEEREGIAEKNRLQGLDYAQREAIRQQGIVEGAQTKANAQFENGVKAMGGGPRLDASDPQVQTLIQAGYHPLPVPAAITGKGSPQVQLIPPATMTVTQDMLPYSLGHKVGDVIPREEFEKHILPAYEKAQENAAKPGARVPLEDRAVAEYQQSHPEASLQQAREATKIAPPREPPKSMMFAPDGKGGFKAIEITPGSTVPAGALTAPGVNTADMPTSQTRTMAETAPKVIDLANRIGQLIDSQISSLGPLQSRWAEFMAGKVGAPNPEFTRLRTNVGLLQTALMRMHLGARGGNQMMEHFTNLIDASKQDPQNLKAALEEIKAYAAEVAKGSHVNDAPGSSGGIIPKFNPATGKLE